MPEQPSKSLKELRMLREEFEASAKKTLFGFDKMIAEAELAERQQEINAILKQFLPADDKASLKGHDIVFLIDKSKDMGYGRESPLGAALDTVYQVNTAINGIEGITVSAKLWGSAGGTSILRIDTYDMVKNIYNTAGANSKDFLPAAKEILASNTPDKLSDRQTHYIIICDGNVTDNVEHSAGVLAAAMNFNPKATFDFIVCGAEAGNMDKLAEPAAKATRFARAGAHGEIAAAVMKSLKTRISESVATKPKPVAPQIGTS